MNSTFAICAFALFFFACNSSPKETEEEKLCFVADTELTKAYANFIVKGNRLEGLVRYETPKAGMTLYEVCSITGSKEGKRLSLTLTTTDTDTGQGLGASRKEVWILQGDSLVQEGTNVSGNLRKVACEENAPFRAEAPAQEVSQTYHFEGTMGAATKIEMFLTAKPHPEDKKNKLWEGYYLVDGQDKKVRLKGLSNAMGLLELEASAEGKTLGKFMIEENFAFNENFACIWLSADGQQELETMLKAVK